MGICHFIEHAVFKGTKKRNALQIARSLESVGGTLNAFTTKEHTCYYANILQEDLSLALDVIADLVNNAAFELRDLDKEKQVILEEIKDTEDTPEEFVQDHFYEDVFSGHPLGFRILGSKTTVSGFTRPQLKAFYQKHYSPKNLVVSVVGNFDEQFLQDLVEAKFASSRRHSGRCLWPAEFVGFRMNGGRRRVNVLSKNIAQAHVCTGLPIRTSYRDISKFKFLAFNTMVGGGMSSRLFQAVRERSGLAYSIYSFVDFLYDGGLFGIYLATDKNKLDRAMGVLDKELSRLAAVPPKKHELKMAKAQIKANLLFGLESTSTRMIRLAKNEIYLGKKVDISDITTKIDRLTVEDMLEVSAELMKNRDRFQTTILK